MRPHGRSVECDCASWVATSAPAATFHTLPSPSPRPSPGSPVFTMAPMKAMKAMKKSGAKPLTKGGLAEAVSSETELKKSDCMKVINSLASVAAQQVKKAGKFVVPGLCMVKTRLKPATKAGKREVGPVVVMGSGGHRGGRSGRPHTYQDAEEAHLAVHKLLFQSCVSSR